jgi:hypothetical protein
METTDNKMPRGLNFFLWLVILAGLTYQAQIAYMVAADFLSGGSIIRAISFTGVIISLLLFVEYVFKQGIISLHNMNKFAWGLLVFITISMSGLLGLEAARIDLQNNGGPLASRIAVEQEQAFAPAVEKIDTKLQEFARIERWDHLKQLVWALETAVDVEIKGGKRPEVEELLNEEGIEFKFSGHPRASKVTAQLASIRDQKKAELKDMTEQMKLRYKDGVFPEPIKGVKEDVAAMEEYRARLVEMKGMELSLETYPKFLELWRPNNKVIPAFANKYHIGMAPVGPPQKSLLIIGLDGAMEFSWSAISVWLMAILSSFAGPISVLLIRSIVMRNRQKEREEADVTHLIANRERRGEPPPVAPPGRQNRRPS